MRHSLRIEAAMPWLVGDEAEFRLLKAGPNGLSLGLLLAPGLYSGYLLSGFEADLLTGRFRPDRPPLAFRAGWNAVAVAVGCDRSASAHGFGPFLAPTAPRPHASVPLGLTLFSTDWLRERLPGDHDQKRPLLEWALLCNALLDAANPVFCDPVLELHLACRDVEEEQACCYRPTPVWRAMLSALAALRSERSGW